MTAKIPPRPGFFDYTDALATDRAHLTRSSSAAMRTCTALSDAPACRMPAVGRPPSEECIEVSDVSEVWPLSYPELDVDVDVDVDVDEDELDSDLTLALFASGWMRAVLPRRLAPRRSRASPVPATYGISGGQSPWSFRTVVNMP